MSIWDNDFQSLESQNKVCEMLNKGLPWEGVAESNSCIFHLFSEAKQLHLSSPPEWPHSAVRLMERLGIWLARLSVAPSTFALSQNLTVLMLKGLWHGHFPIFLWHSDRQEGHIHGSFSSCSQCSLAPSTFISLPHDAPSSDKFSHSASQTHL